MYDASAFCHNYCRHRKTTNDLFYYRFMHQFCHFFSLRPEISHISDVGFAQQSVTSLTSCKTTNSRGHVQKRDLRYCNVMSITDKSSFKLVLTYNHDCAASAAYNKPKGQKFARLLAMQQRWNKFFFLERQNPPLPP